MAGHIKFASDYGDITQALRGSTILITGGAGFLASATLCRLLLDPILCDSIKQVITLIRGDNVQAAAARLPTSLVPFTHTVDSTSRKDAKLVVLNGDCQKVGFGLEGEMLEIAQRVDILIHAAGDFRFTLSFANAIGGIVDLAYMSSRFTLTSPRVKTHIFLSTSYVCWFMKHNSHVYEDFTPEPLAFDNSENETHVNTYLHAKTLAEGCVNALFGPQAGRPLDGRAARIVRLATLGPAAIFPSPGWGAGHTSSPVCAAVAAKHVPPDKHTWLPEGAFLEIIPVDIAVNQLLALTAAVHRTHSLPAEDLAHPRNPQNPINQHGTNIPCYHIGTGLSPFYQAHYLTLNKVEVKLRKPSISNEQLLYIFKTFISKIVNFDNTRTRKILGIKPFKSAEAESPNNGDESTDHIDDSGKAILSGTTRNIDRVWSDPPIDCGKLDVDCALAIEGLWGSLGGEDAPGWVGYLKCVRDKMESRGTDAGECYVD